MTEEPGWAEHGKNSRRLRRPGSYSACDLGQTVSPFCVSVSLTEKEGGCKIPSATETHLPIPACTALLRHQSPSETGQYVWRLEWHYSNASSIILNILEALLQNIETAKISFNRFYLSQYIKNIIISTFSQYKNLRISIFLF